MSSGSSGENIGERVQAITDGKGAYAGVDAVGGELTGELLKGIRPKGTLAIYGILSGFKFEGNIRDVLFHIKVKPCALIASFRPAHACGYVTCRPACLGHLNGCITMKLCQVSH